MLRFQTHAVRHDTLAKMLVLPGEDSEVFKLLIVELEHRFSPVDEVELGFIEEMAAAYWRMRRGWTAETEILRQGLLASRQGQRQSSQPLNAPAL